MIYINRIKKKMGERKKKQPDGQMSAYHWDQRALKGDVFTTKVSLKARNLCIIENSFVVIGTALQLKS